MNGTRMAVAIEPALDERYRIVQQEVDLGVSALRENDPVIAITLFQSALQKISINDPSGEGQTDDAPQLELTRDDPGHHSLSLPAGLHISRITYICLVLL